MKQQTTYKQFKELNSKEKEKIVREMFGGLIYNPKDDPPLFTIGQLIEYLGEEEFVEHISDWDNDWGMVLRYKPNDRRYKLQSLIDALWESCKYKLRKQ